MDTHTFYAVIVATCLTLVGIRWFAVRDKKDWYKTKQYTTLLEVYVLRF